MIEDWRRDDNTHRPHSALGMMAPTEFADGYRAYKDALAAGLRPPSGLAPPGGDALTLQPTPTHRLSQQADR